MKNSRKNKMNKRWRKHMNTQSRDTGDIAHKTQNKD